MIAARESPFARLSFLTGRWVGGGFVIQFTDPLDGMMFGSMQASEGGRTVYRETFRFVEDADGSVLFYPVKAGKSLGAYRLVELCDGERKRLVLENPVLRRSQRRYGGPARQSLVDRHARRGRPARGTGEARPGDDGVGVARISANGR
jgi:hypothetical protein